MKLQTSDFKHPASSSRSPQGVSRFARELSCARRPWRCERAFCTLQPSAKCRSKLTDAVATGCRSSNLDSNAAYHPKVRPIYCLKLNFKLSRRRSKNVSSGQGENVPTVEINCIWIYWKLFAGNGASRSILQIQRCSRESREAGKRGTGKRASMWTPIFRSFRFLPV